MNGEKSPPLGADLLEARARISPWARRTPVLSDEQIDRQLGCRVFFKAEGLQQTGSFKARGATNAVFSLTDEEARRGVATHSSGNHAAALAWAARRRGLVAHIVMPANAPPIKTRSVEENGGRIVFCEPTLEAREETLHEVLAETGAHFVPPYDDPRIIAGQGTAALELFEDAGELDFLLAPVGGGGLMSGCALAAAVRSPATRLFGAEPAGADDAFRSLKEGRLIPQENPRTIADGLRTQLSPLTFGILRRHLQGILTVSEEGIARAMRLVFERLKLVIEPSAAVPLAALLEQDIGQRGQRVGLVLSGGNIEPERLGALVQSFGAAVGEASFSTGAR